ncbi:MAG: glycosyltransferase [Desulfobacterales bacterium]
MKFLFVEPFYGGSHKNFGIPVVEAARYGCLPLLPQRLSYPEIIPREFHETVLYRSEDELVEKLANILLRPDAYEPARKAISAAMAAFSWQHRITGFDAELEALAGAGPDTER